MSLQESCVKSFNSDLDGRVPFSARVTRVLGDVLFEMTGPDLCLGPFSLSHNVAVYNEQEK